jgi:Flp pilus assembly protein TadG
MLTFLTRKRSRGQALVEFALVIPVFLFILFALIDMGRYVYLNSTLSQAAREGARVASVEAYWMGKSDASCGSAAGPVCPANLTALRTDVLAGANRMMQPFATLTNSDLFTSCDASTPPGTVTSQTCSSQTIGGLASVRVTSTYRPLTPLISSIFPTIPTQASATMVIN